MAKKYYLDGVEIFYKDIEARAKRMGIGVGEYMDKYNITSRKVGIYADWKTEGLVMPTLRAAGDFLGIGTGDISRSRPTYGGIDPTQLSTDELYEAITDKSRIQDYIPLSETAEDITIEDVDEKRKEESDLLQEIYTQPLELTMDQGPSGHRYPELQTILSDEETAQKGFIGEYIKRMRNPKNLTQGQLDGEWYINKATEHLTSQGYEPTRKEALDYALNMLSFKNPQIEGQPTDEHQLQSAAGGVIEGMVEDPTPGVTTIYEEREDVLPDWLRDIPDDMYGNSRKQVPLGRELWLGMRDIVPDFFGLEEKVALPDWWQDDNPEREAAYQHVLDKIVGEEFEMGNNKYNRDVASMDKNIETRLFEGMNYDDQELITLGEQIEAEKDSAKKKDLEEQREDLYEKKRYVKIFDENGEFINWIPKDIEASAQDLAGTNEGTTGKENLKRMRRDLYYRWLTLAKQNNANILQDKRSGLSVVDYEGYFGPLHTGAKKVYNWPKTKEALEKASEIGEFVESYEIPGGSKSATEFNKVMLQLKTINRALEINMDPGLLAEEGFFKEIIWDDNDKVVGSFKDYMDMQGYVLPYDVVRKRAPYQILNPKYRSLMEGGRDVATGLLPLVASVYLFKRIPVGVVKSADKSRKAYVSMEVALNNKINKATKFVTNNTNSPTARRITEVAGGALKETIVLSGADVIGKKLFDSEPIVFNAETGDFNPLFAASLGAGNVVGRKVINRMLTGNSRLTRTLAVMSGKRGGNVAGSFGESMVGAGSGTATYWFASLVTSNWDQLTSQTGGFFTVENVARKYEAQGYDWEEAKKLALDEVKHTLGAWHMAETFIGMWMLGSPGSLTKMGQAMKNELLEMPGSTALTRRAAKHMNIKEDAAIDQINLTEQKMIDALNKSNPENLVDQVKQVKSAATVLRSRHDLLLAKKIAQEHGTYEDALRNTFALGNKLKMNMELTPTEWERYNNLKTNEFNILKHKLAAGSGSQFAQILDNKKEVIKSIIENVDAGKIYRPKEANTERSNIIKMSIKQAEINGEINRLKEKIKEEPGAEGIHEARRKELLEQQVDLQERMEKEINSYNKKVKDAIRRETSRVELAGRDIGAGLKVVNEKRFEEVAEGKGEGLFIRTPSKKDPGGKMYINKKRAEKLNQIGVADHELFHAATWDALMEPGAEGRVKKEAIDLIDQFLLELPKEQREKLKAEIDAVDRYERDSQGEIVREKNKNEYYDEYLTKYGHMLKDGRLKENKTAREALSDLLITPIYRSLFPNLYRGKLSSVETGKDLFNLVRSFHRERQRGEYRTIIEFAKGTSPEKAATAIQKSVGKRASKTKEEKINELGEKYTKKEWDAGGDMEALGKLVGSKDALLRTLITSKVDALKEFEGLKTESQRELLRDEVELHIMSHIRNFDISKKEYEGGFGLSGWINGQLRNKIIDKTKELWPTQEMLMDFGDPSTREFFADVLNPMEIMEQREATELRAKQEVSFKTSLKLRDADGRPIVTKVLRDPNTKEVTSVTYGVSDAITKKVEETVTKVYSGKLPTDPSTKEYKKALLTAYRAELQNTILDAMGTNQTIMKFNKETKEWEKKAIRVGKKYKLEKGEIGLYDLFLKENWEAFLDKSSISNLVKIERLQKDKIFAEKEGRLTKVEDLKKAIDAGLIDPNTYSEIGPALYKKLPTTYEQVFNFFRGKDIKPSTQGTRKDAMARTIAEEIAFDATMETVRSESIQKRRAEIAELTGQERAANEISVIAKRIDRGVDRRWAKAKISPQEFALTARHLVDLLSKNKFSDVLTDKGRLRKEFRYYRGKKIDRETIDFVLDLKNDGYINREFRGETKEILTKIIQTVGAKKRGRVYEWMVIDLGNKTPGINMLTKKPAEGGKPDFHAQLWGADFFVETKLENAQHGSIGLKSLDFSNPKLDLVKKGTYKEYEPLFKEMLSDATEALKAYNDRAVELMNDPVFMEGKTIDIKKIYNNTKIPSNVYKQLGRELENLQAKVTQVRKMTADVVAKIYNNKEYANYYMNILGKGLYFLGENKLGLTSIPELIGDVEMRFRFVAGDHKPVNPPGPEYAAFHTPGQKYYSPSIRLIPKIDPKSLKASPFSIDTKAGIKAFMNSDGVKRREQMYDKQALKDNNGGLKNVIGKRSSKTSTKDVARDIRIINEAIEFGRKGNTERRGISIWDLDDTLIRSKSGVLYKMPNPEGKPQPGRKAIFLAGGPGAGKSTVIKNLGLRKQGFKIVNQDISLEWLMKNHGLPKDMKDFTKEQASKFGELTWDARMIAKEKQLKYQGKGDGVIIDGTGSSLKSMQVQMFEFKRKGYDVQMLFVESSKETAVARNKARKERSLKTSIVERTWDNVMKNKRAFMRPNMFGENFIEINTDRLKRGDALPTEVLEKMNAFVSGYKKGRLDPGKFAEKGGELKRQGAEFDFMEFYAIREGKKGPLFNDAMSRIKKYGNKDNFILTARPPEAAPYIHEFLKSIGMDIPMENIKGLGNSTAEAKALWVLEKAAEGYNDFYFADDATKNVKEVGNVLSQLDVKGKVQQARRFSKTNLNKDFNKIIEETTGIPKERVFSDVKAAMIGSKKGKYKFVVPPSAEDFAGLMYSFLGKGKQGEAHYEFFNENLMKPFGRGYNDFNMAKQAVANDYSALRKKLKGVRKKLNKAVKGTSFTHDAAIRVHRWTEAGYEIPGLAKSDAKKLNDAVKKDTELMTFSEALGVIAESKGGYVEPGKHWLAENINADLGNLVNKVGRKKFLGDWIENKNLIFSKENLNKIEAVHGTNFREALEDMLYRMENGTNRAAGTNRLTNSFMNWTNRSVSAIMNWNMRSALLQNLSSVNFINWRDNNPLRAAQAFANQPQYWKDFATLFNSDYLKQRRAGLQMNVNAAEIASAVHGSKNKATAALEWFLKKGFIPTKMADSFAIASGGATMYRNRIKKYEKQGFTTKEAERKAFFDFQEIAEPTQQSARPDMISQQQASPLGRLILAFANTPMQYTRLMKKAVLDIANRRGDFKTNLSKVLYYGAIQNVIFSTLQAGMFSMLFTDHDDDYIKNKEIRIANTMTNSLLRGMGVGGATVAAIKDGVVRFIQENKKDYRADYANVVVDMINVSPPIGSKVRKLYSAGKSWKYNKEVIPEMGLSINNPGFRLGGQVVSALTNVPLDRVVDKTNNLQSAFSGDYEFWQRMAFFLGYNKWDIDLRDEEVEKTKKELKEKKKKKKGPKPYKFR